MPFPNHLGILPDLPTLRSKKDIGEWSEFPDLSLGSSVKRMEFLIITKSLKNFKLLHKDSVPDRLTLLRGRNGWVDCPGRIENPNPGPLWIFWGVEETSKENMPPAPPENGHVDDTRHDHRHPVAILISKI